MDNKRFIDYIKVMEGDYIKGYENLLNNYYQNLIASNIDIKSIYIRLKEKGYDFKHTINFINDFNTMKKDGCDERNVLNFVLDSIDINSKYLSNNKDNAIEYFGMYITSSTHIRDLEYTLLVSHLRATSRVYLNKQKVILQGLGKIEEGNKKVYVKRRLNNRLEEVNLNNYFKPKYLVVDRPYLGIGINNDNWEIITDDNLGGIYDYVFKWE